MDKLELIQTLRDEELARLRQELAPFKRRSKQHYSDEHKQACMDEIFQRIEEGESVYLICEDEHLPTRALVMQWLEQDAGWRERYDSLAGARARSFFELALNEVQRAYDPQGMKVAVARANVYMRAAALLNPKVYSDKTHSALAKTGPTQPIAITLNIGGQAQEHKGELTVLPQPESGDLP